tara:strand:+ start:211 stop:375 length:165 start_codon:yes stop_codon:yes gene_type:complete
VSNRNNISKARIIGKVFLRRGKSIGWERREFAGKQIQQELNREPKKAKLKKDYT